MIKYTLVAGSVPGLKRDITLRARNWAHAVERVKAKDNMNFI